MWDLLKHYGLLMVSTFLKDYNLPFSGYNLEVECSSGFDYNEPEGWILLSMVMGKSLTRAYDERLPSLYSDRSR